MMGMYVLNLTVEFGSLSYFDKSAEILEHIAVARLYHARRQRALNINLRRLKAPLKEVHEK